MMVTTIDLTARCARYEEALQMIAKGDSDPTILALLAYAALHNQPPVETAVEQRISGLLRLLDRAYPWLHNPYRGTTDIANRAEGDAVIREVEQAIAHLKDEPDPLLSLPCASCDGDGCPNCEPPMVLSE
jgi:hypothetical protein